VTVSSYAAADKNRFTTQHYTRLPFITSHYTC